MCSSDLSGRKRGLPSAGAWAAMLTLWLPPGEPGMAEAALAGAPLPVMEVPVVELPAVELAGAVAAGGVVLPERPLPGRAPGVSRT